MSRDDDTLSFPLNGYSDMSEIDIEIVQLQGRSKHFQVFEGIYQKFFVPGRNKLKSLETAKLFENPRFVIVELLLSYQQAYEHDSDSFCLLVY